MPVGAVIGAAVVGAGATVATGAMASHSQKKAADKAADTQQQVATQNNTLARDTYNANAARLDPYSAMGLAAGDAYLGLLLGDKATHEGSGWAPLAATSSSPGSTPAPPAAPSAPGPATTNLSLAVRAANGLFGAHLPIPTGGALASVAPQSATPAQSALAPVVVQQARDAIAAGADPEAVRSRARDYGVML